MPNANAKTFEQDGHRFRWWTEKGVLFVTGPGGQQKSTGASDSFDDKANEVLARMLASEMDIGTSR